MLKLIIASLTKNEEEQQPAVYIELPATDEILKKAAEEIGSNDFKNGGYEMIGHFFGKYDDLQKTKIIE